MFFFISGLSWLRACLLIWLVFGLVEGLPQRASPCTPATLRTPLQAHRTTGCNLLHLHPKLLCTPLHLHPQVYDVCGTDMRLYNQPLIKFTKACVQAVSGTNWFLSGEGAGLG